MILASVFALARPLRFAESLISLLADFVLTRDLGNLWTVQYTLDGSSRHSLTTGLEEKLAPYWT